VGSIINTVFSKNCTPSGDEEGEVINVCKSKKECCSGFCKPMVGRKNEDTRGCLDKK